MTNIPNYVQILIKECCRNFLSPQEALTDFSGSQFCSVSFLDETKITHRNLLATINSAPAWICLSPPIPDSCAMKNLNLPDLVSYIEFRSLEIMSAFLSYLNLEYFSLIFYNLSLAPSELLLKNKLGENNNNYYVLLDLLEKVKKIKKSPKTQLVIIENSQIFGISREARLIKRLLS